MPPAHEPADDIDRWLATFSALARMPEARRAAVTDELEDHLRCRSRDLMLRGASEPEAIHTSIAELGEAAELAARFRLAARTPIWRHVMTFSILGISAAALTVSVIALAGGPQQQAGGPTGVVFRSAQQEATSDTLADIRLNIEMHDAPIAGFFEQAAGAAGKPVFVHWDSLPIEPEEQVTLQLGEVSFPTALRLLNTRIGRAGGDEAIDFRLRDGVLEFSTRGDFDQQEAQLVRYDLTPVLGRATPEDVADLIYNLVDPYSWDANGGTTASLHLAGEQMFIKAPQRMFPKIEWILAQFNEPEPAAAADGDKVTLRVIPLREADAGALGQALEEILADLSGVRITTDARTNALIVSATAIWHDRIEALLPLLDRPPSDAPAAEASAAKLRAAYQAVHASSISTGAFPATADRLLEQLADMNLLGIVATRDQFMAPDGQPYWLDLPAMQTMNSQRIVGYDRGAFARSEQVATLFADGHVETLAPLRLRDLMDDAPNADVDFKLPVRQVGAAPAAPVCISADRDGQILCRWTDADGREYALRATTISLHAGAVAFQGAAELSAGASGASTAVVQTGDSLPSIAAAALGDSSRVSEILALNPGLDPSRLAPGQRITLPR